MQNGYQPKDKLNTKNPPKGGTMKRKKTKGPGRRPLDPGARRSVIIGASFTPAENVTINKTASLMGRTPADFVRVAVLNTIKETYTDTWEINANGSVLKKSGGKNG